MRRDAQRRGTLIKGRRDFGWPRRYSFMANIEGRRRWRNLQEKRSRYSIEVLQRLNPGTYRLVGLKP